MSAKRASAGTVPATDTIAWGLTAAIVLSYAVFIAAMVAAPQFFAAPAWLDARVSMGMLISLVYMVGCVAATYLYLRHARNAVS